MNKLETTTSHEGGKDMTKRDMVRTVFESVRDDLSVGASFDNAVENAALAGFIADWEIAATHLPSAFARGLPGSFRCREWCNKYGSASFDWVLLSAIDALKD